MSRENHRTWWVEGPEVCVRSAVLYENPEPPEYGRDCVLVAARTKQEALVAAVREFRKTGAHYLDDGYSNPFTKLEARDAGCPHGFYPQNEEEMCERCMADWEREDEENLDGLYADD